MSPQRQNTIRSAFDRMAREQPALFGVLRAVLHGRNLHEARRVCGHVSAEHFTRDYHRAVEHLVQGLRDRGYEPPLEADAFDDRIGGEASARRVVPAKLPSPEVIDRWYKGHILHEACAIVAAQNRVGLAKLWDRFPHRRHEIEIAIALAPNAAPSVVVPRLLSPPVQRHRQRFLPTLAGACAVGVVLLLALFPPASGRARNAIVANFEEMLVSAQGVFDMGQNAPPEPKVAAPAPEPKVIAPPKTVPRPQIALPDKPKRVLAALPDISRQRDLPQRAFKTRPNISAPRLDRGATPSSFFGSRPEVTVARPTLRMPSRGPATLPPPERTDKDMPQAEVADLKGYRPAGRIGFSSFRASAGLSAELARLTRIQRALARLKTQENRIFENAQLALAPDRARIHFADGIAFALTFRRGRLDNIQIFARSGLRKSLHIETQARRGIRLLNRALGQS